MNDRELFDLIWRISETMSASDSIGGMEYTRMSAEAFGDGDTLPNSNDLRLQVFAINKLIADAFTGS